MACSSECVCLRPLLMISSVSGQCLLCGNTWRRIDLCVMSPTHSWLLDLAVEIAPAEWKTLYLRQKPENFEIHSRRTHRGCSWFSFGCKCVVTEHVGGSRMAPQLARKMQRMCTGGHVHVQRTLDQQKPVRMRRAIVTSIRQTRDRLETGQCVAAEKRGRGTLSAVHTFRYSPVLDACTNLGHPKKTSCHVHCGAWKRRQSSCLVLDQRQS